MKTAKIISRVLSLLCIFFLANCMAPVSITNLSSPTDESAAPETPSTPNTPANPESPAPATPVCNFNPSTYMTASTVIGQPNMTSNSSNQGLGAPTAKTFSGVDGVSIANGKLFVGDFSNYRYLIFNSIPTTDNASADLVLGQMSFTTVSTTASSSITSAGREAVWTGSQLILADGWNGRLLVYNSFPTSNGQAADLVVGQSNFSSVGGALAVNRIDSVYGGLTFFGSKLWLADNSNNRVLSFNLPISANLPNALQVLGQPDFTTGVGAATAVGMNGPTKPIIYGGKLIVADRYNSRVLIYNSIPSGNTATADVVIGQTNFTGGNQNQGLGAPTARTLSEPHGVATDDSGRLYISDSFNNRVLVYNSIPTVNNAAADLVIGQPDFISAGANAGGSTSAKSLNKTTDLTFFNCSLIVGDQSNNRVLVFK